MEVVLFVANRLDEVQEQQLDALMRSALMRSYLRPALEPGVIYGFRSASPSTDAKDAITRSLGVYVVGHPATTEAELDQRKSLQARFLARQDIPMDRYRDRLRAQKGGASVPAMRAIPVALAPGKTTAHDEEFFE
ncbi:uncharacterized protein PHALS_10766 [Plasmopara halstedii]|uniref:Uncharacterized protein n=1 Tax=Plasmopara halstedii TaxID=4781 RepID=A0A0P1AI76_PLAHL|nr:uncharacterized protein PHALS_10766 [Plasmopara halstedii]CEG40577.1 hypothetical protein PHALS_10766 [Plasmopara halstedii]|eukprot:XP_024576946.1 hypothetical protein PHALS_10766 [Plasmopara halstedii]